MPGQSDSGYSAPASIRYCTISGGAACWANGGAVSTRTRPTCFTCCSWHKRCSSVVVLGDAEFGCTGRAMPGGPYADATYCGHDHPDTPSAFRARTWKKYQPWSVGRLLTSALVPVIVIVMPLTGALVESRT